MTFDGKAFGAELVGVVKGFLEKEMEPIRARLDAMEERIEGAVKEALAALPAPSNDKGVSAEELTPLIASEVAKRVSELPRANDGEPGKDGAGLAGALIDRGGNLVLTLTNGETKDLGPVVGKDGEPGKPGTDGIGFDDLDVTYDGSKGFALKFTRGDQVKEFAFALPVVIDRGVYKAGDEYEPGDGVTWAGSFWIAQEKTSEKPDSGQGWRLAVKRGRDGKSAPVSRTGPKEPLRVGVPAKGK